MLCDTCFWRVQCLTYDNLKPDEEIYKCVDDYGGIDYLKDPKLKRYEYEKDKNDL